MDDQFPSSQPSPQEPATPVSESSTSESCSHCAEYLAGWKRAQADYSNLQKEVTKERGEFSKYANERLLERLLPAVDQFEMALAFIPDLTALPEDVRKKLENWIAGFKAVRSTWESAFRDIGLEHVPTEGAFDPSFHEAVGEELSDTISPGSILRTVQSGWRLQGKVLRPARVILAASTTP